MANQPSKYSKFLLGAASAALVASAVAPVASAADFKDTKGNTHEVAIDALSDLGIINGYPDGSFQPNKTLTRSDVVKMMGKWLVSLGHEVPTDYKSNPRFTDLNANSNNELLQYAALVADHGVFQGNNGKLDPTGNITRENMALVLVRAYDAINGTDLVETVKAEDFDRDVTDLATAKAEARPYIDVLDFYDITNPAAPVFNPKGTTTRGQFASFLHRTANLEETALELRIIDVVGLNDTNQFLQINFSKPVTTGLDPSDIQIRNSKSGDSYGVREVKLAADGKSAQVELFQPREGDIVLEYVTDYDISVNANGELLTFVFNRPLFSEARIVDIDVAGNKFTAVDDKTGNSVTVKVLKDTEFDYQGAIGELVRVWYNGDKELVKYEIQSATAEYDAIEIDDKDTIKLITADKKVDITDDEYTGNNKNDDYKFKLYVDGKEVTTSNGEIPSDLAKKRFNFAKVGYDKAGEIEYVSAYSLNEFLVVDKVDGKEIVGIEGDASGSFNAKDATIIKDGKVISLDDVKKGDILFFSNDADDKDGFAEVLNNTVKGKITDTFLEAIRVDGKTYDFVHDKAESDKFVKKDYANAVFLNDRDRLEYIDEDTAEELQAAGDVTLYFDRAGNLVYVGGDTADVAKNTKTSILTEDIKVKTDFGKSVAQFETVNQDGDDKLYQIDLETLKTIVVNGKDYDIDKNADESDEWKVSHDDTHIVLTSGTGVVERIALKAAGTVVNFKLDDASVVKELEFFTSTSAKEGYGSTTSVVEAGDNYVGGKRLLSNTVVFDAKKAASNGTIDEKDVKVTTWSEYKGSDITSSYYIYNDDNEVIALVIKDTSAQDTVEESALITNVLRNSDKEIIEITAFVNGAKKTYKVDEVKFDSVEKGSTVVLEFDKDNSDVIDDIKAATSSFVKEDLIVDTVDSGRREVTFVDGTKARLVSNGLVLNGSDSTDITTKALSDLRGENIKVTVLYDEKGSEFAKYFVYEKISKADYDELKADQTKDQVAKVEALINALPTAANIKLSHEADVKKARDAYDALTTAQKEKVSSTYVEKLEAAEKAIADLKEENPVEIEITTATAVGTDLSALLGNYTYTVEGTVAGQDVEKVTLTFTGEDEDKTETVDVVDGKFTFTATAGDLFGVYSKVEVSSGNVKKQADINVSVQ
ncbi:S-layer homology domain-containing protein [Sporosarcina sp. ACRSM]|uniref:S-layer homology domain-containing protein n=1 Tax=Sporosarcina sp. ACRSM TaxID=2918216 RepID=UPI001EF6D540|nr:S-layer homology domain-containing protein [Sporosarcina sp. ACRSM]MCG7337382.1 S-layer homology domain-containing protein [Sporosarcina sp. ACRSM]